MVFINCSAAFLLLLPAAGSSSDRSDFPAMPPTYSFTRFTRKIPPHTRASASKSSNPKEELSPKNAKDNSTLKIGLVKEYTATLPTGFAFNKIPQTEYATEEINAI